MTLPATVTIEVGTTCLWSSERRDSHDHPIGGVVMDESYGVVMDEGYEVTNLRPLMSYVVLDPYNTNAVTTHVLREDEIGTNGCQPVERGQLVILARRLMKAMVAPEATKERKRVGMADWLARERDYLRWLGVLVEAEAELRGRA